MFSINNFRSDLNRRGILRDNRGGILLPIPRGLQGQTIDPRDVAIRCERLTLPGIWFQKQEGHRRYGYGPTDRNPEAPNFDPIRLEFIVDKRGEVYDFFNQWFNLVTNFNSSQGLRAPNQSGALPYESTYPQDYVVDLSLFAYDEDEQKILQYNLTRAWPSQLEEVEIAHSNYNNHVSLKVTFEYRDWNLKSRFSNVLSDFFNFGGNQLERVAENFFDNLTGNLF